MTGSFYHACSDFNFELLLIDYKTAIKRLYEAVPGMGRVALVCQEWDCPLAWHLETILILEEALIRFQPVAHFL